MKDFLGNELPVTIPAKFDYSRHEISISQIERRALLKGFAIASERLLQDLRTIKRPSQQLRDLTERLTIDLQKIGEELGNI